MNTTNISNGALQTVRIYLSPAQNFKLYIVFIEYQKKRYIIDARLEYKEQFISKSYQSTKYLIETIGLYAHRYELDIDCSDFEITQQKDENEKVKKTLCCKFLKTQAPDKDIYLNRGLCKTMYHIFHDSIYGHSRIWALEKKLHNEIFPSVFYQNPSRDSYNDEFRKVNLPKVIQDIIFDYLEMSKLEYKTLL